MTRAKLLVDIDVFDDGEVIIPFDTIGELSATEFEFDHQFNPEGDYSDIPILVYDNEIEWITE